MKKLFGMLFAMILAFVGVTTVSAHDKTIKFHDRRLSGVNQIYDVGTTYKYVETSEGTKIGYCFNKVLDAPNDGNILTADEKNGVLPNAVKTNQLIYILDNGYGGNWNTGVIGSNNYTNDQKYYITQVAVWMAQGAVNPETIKNTGTLGAAAYNLYSAAVKNSTVIAYTPEVVINGKLNFTLSNSQYVSNELVVSVKGSNSVKLTLNNAPAGTKLIVNGTEQANGVTVNSGSKFKVVVPEKSVTSDVKIDVIATSSAVRKKIQIYYDTTNSARQNIGLIFTEGYTARAVVSATIAPRGGLLIEKIDNKGNYLAGATLVLSDTTGKVVAKWTTGNTKETNQKTFNNLKLGSKYVISEIVAPKGYRKIADKTITVNSAKVQKISIVDENIKDIVISKQDITTGEELPGAKLVVKDSTGKVIDEWTSTNEPHYIKKELTPGTYTLTETMAPEGYVLSTEKVTFVVNKDGSVDGTVVMKNAPKKGVTISKQDATTDKELPGATLVLKDSTGKVVETWVSGDKPHYIDDLADGDYYLSETIAPEGYDLSTTTVKFTITHDGKVLEPVVMKNYPTKKGIYISKQDITNGKELPGATLIVKDEQGNVIDKWVSGKKPHYIENLKPGNYTLIEISSPKGYELSEEVIEFTIDKNGKNAKTIVMTNSPIPETSGVNVGFVIFGLIASVGLVAFGFTKLNKQA